MMAYADGFVASVFLQNSPLREIQKDGLRTVYLPFGSEYKIRLKNSHKRERAMAQVFIDGMDIAAGKRFIIPRNGIVDLERFLVDGDMNRGRHFKFISVDQGIGEGTITDPTSPDLGIIEVRFWKEDLPAPSPLRTVKNSYRGSGQMATMDCSYAAVPSSADPQPMSASLGGTAEGSESLQAFRHGDDFPVHVLPTILQIRMLGLPTAHLPRFEIRGSQVVNRETGQSISDTFRMEQGELWARLTQ